MPFLLDRLPGAMKRLKPDDGHPAAPLALRCGLTVLPIDRRRIIRAHVGTMELGGGPCLSRLATIG